MTQLSDLLNWALAQQGKPYKVGPGRFGMAYFDCSGFTARAMREVGLNPPTVSSTQARWVRQSNTIIPIQEGIYTPGALLFQGPAGGELGFGPLGHVAFSLGDGRTIEARGRQFGVGVFNANGRPWSRAGTIPGIQDHIIYPPAPPIEFPVKEEDMKSALVSVGPLDKNGNGFGDWNPRLGRDPVIVSASLQGPNPPADGYWYEGWKPIVAAQAHGGVARVSVIGGRPKSTVGVNVSVA